MIAETTAATVSSVVTALGSEITAIMGYVGDVAQKAVTEPLFLIPMGFFILGGAVGIVSRILHK